MANYFVVLKRTASLTLSLGNVTAPAASMRRLRLYDVMIGQEGTVADNPTDYLFQRCTTTGTRTSVTPQPLDPADAACVATAGQNHTVEPTYTAGQVAIDVPLNQRAVFRWIAAPGCEVIVPATANNGIGVQTPVSGLVLTTATIHFAE
jgi:hypothetical protein